MRRFNRGSISSEKNLEPHATFGLFEGANDAIVTIRGGSFVDCNRKALELFRCTTEELFGRRPGHFSMPLQPDGRESGAKAQEKIEAALAGSPQIFEWHHRRCDGTLFQAEVSLNRVESQGAVELQAVIRDITERKEMERMKDEVISAVSHEMRTPLTAMLGFTEFLLENEAAIEPLRREQLGREWISLDMFHNVRSFSINIARNC